MPNYPTSLDALANPTATTLRNDPGFELHAVISTLNDIAEALQQKVGIGASVPAAGTVLRGTAPGASAFGALQAPDLDPVALAALVADNPVINGDFPIWQRGTAFGNLSGFGADRWALLNNTGTGVVNLNQLAGNHALAQAPTATIPQSPYLHYLSVATAKPSLAGPDVVLLDQKIEGYLWASLVGRQFTISFSVRANPAGQYTLGLISGDAKLTYLAPFTVTTASTWQPVTLTISPSPLTISGGAWNFENGIGVYLRFFLVSGTTTSTANAWSAGNLPAYTGQVNFLGSTSNTFMVKQVKITPGPYAAPWSPRPFGLEYQLCMRYTEVLTGAFNYFGVGYAQSAVASVFMVPYMVAKRAAPTVTFGGVASDYLISAASGGGAATGLPGLASGATVKSVLLAIPTTGLTLGQSNIVGFSSSTNGKITIDAEP